MTHTISRLCLLLCTLSLLTQPAAFAADDADPLSALCQRFSGYDSNDDGVVEIEALRPLSNPAGRAAAPLVLVLVEQRLLEKSTEKLDLNPTFQAYAEDLVADGWRVRLIGASLYSGARHQDGRTLLALRAFLRATHEQQPRLRGVVLVGGFPDAFLVRTCNWIRRTPITIRKRRPDARVFREKVPYLRTRPEPVAHRADIVLADLDGQWADRYVESPTDLPYAVGVFPGGVPEGGGVASVWERGSVRFTDFFHVDDGPIDLEERADGLQMTPRWKDTDAECAPSDRVRKNPLAQPELLVSRIDAGPVALRPRPDVRGVRGEGLLDADGQPQSVRFPSHKSVPRWSGVWEPDPSLERLLLAAFFERNHRFRRGYVSRVGFRPASIAHGLGSGMRVVRRAHAAWRGFKNPGYDLGQASLVDLVDWLRRPAALRTLRAHSDRWGSVFARKEKTQVALLEAALRELRPNARPWSWSKRGAELRPSLAAACGRGKADFFLYRSLWEAGLRVSPHILLHTGCESISPPGAERLPWSDPAYGRANGAASLLFYGGALALVGRAKVFYDEPRGFAEALREGKTVGEGWARYYEVESSGPTFRAVGGRIGRKRAYFWSVLGDWTLRLRPPPAFY